MTAMTRAEFEATATTAATPVKTVEDWAAQAGTIFALVALSHENLSKDEIVEAIQKVALKMPAELVAEAAFRLTFVSMEIDL